MTAKVYSFAFALAAAMTAGMASCALHAQGAPSAAMTPSAAAVPMQHTPYPDGAGTQLGSAVATLLADPAVLRAHWGIAVTALDGTPIYGHREGELYRPASNNKLFTTAAAMAMLGPDSTVKTALIFTKPNAEGTSSGDLTLYGEGDANLSGDDLPYLTSAEKQARDATAKAEGKTVAQPDPFHVMDEFAASVASAGVKQINGDVVGSDTNWTWEPYPIAWDIGDMLTGDGAPVSALSFIDNLLTVKVTAGAKAGDAASVTVTPDTGYYQLEVNVTTVAAGTRASFDIARAPGAKLVRIYGTAAVGETHTDEIAIADPAEFAARVLKEKLIAHGVQVTGAAREQHRWPTDAESFYRETHEPITLDPTQVAAVSTGLRSTGQPEMESADHTSPTLAEDVYLTLKVSQNLHAELMLQRLGRGFGADTATHNTTAQGARVVRQFAINAGIDGDDFMLYDGSGMSSHDLIAPRALAKLLQYAQAQPWFAAWKASLPVGGVDGSLRSRFPDAPMKNHVFAKTGTLGESRALSGYVDCASGKQVIFSIMVDDHSPGSAADRVTMDKIVAAIAAAE
jgi:D-alanyl-D-alanine carboxypeptidase/D-alanyl-D-alanine-endopeptidase (penicillin-binding protein 4)